jgi:hypothetical protein
MLSWLTVHLAGLFALLSDHTLASSVMLLATAPIAMPDGGGDDGGDGDGDGDGAGGSSGDLDIAAVGRAILADIPIEEQQRQLSEKVDDGAVDDDDLEFDGGEGEGKPAKPAKPETVPTDSEGAEATKGGKKAPAAPAAGKKPAPAAEGEGEFKKVTLKGLAERGEEDVEIEVDEELANRIGRLQNDAMRATDYKARRAELEDREAMFEARIEALEADPLAFIMQRIPVDKQIEIAKLLVTEHLEAINADIEALQDDPAAQQRQRVALRDRLKTSEGEAAQRQEVKTYAAKCIRAVESLIPEGIDDDMAADFMRDARQELAALARSGTPVTPEKIPELIAKRVKLYGFDKPAAAAPARKPAAPAQAAAPVARPGSDKAREIASRKQSPAATQSRILRTQTARNAGSRVAPVGAGAGPTSMPAEDGDADLDIASMSKTLRQRGLPDSWVSGE